MRPYGIWLCSISRVNHGVQPNDATVFGPIFHISSLERERSSGSL